MNKQFSDSFCFFTWEISFWAVLSVRFLLAWIRILPHLNQNLTSVLFYFVLAVNQIWSNHTHSVLRMFFWGGGVALLYFFVAYLLFMGFKYTWFVVRGLNIVNTVLWCGKGQWVVQGHLLISLLFLQSWFFPGWWRGRKKGWRRAEEREMRFEGSYSSILSKRLKNWWCSVACDNKYFLKGLHLAFT